MGLDLTIAIEQWPSLTEHGFLAHNRLSFERDYAVFEMIADKGRSDEPVKRVCDPKLCDFKVEWYEDEGIDEDAKTDPHGNPLTYVTAGEMSKIPLDICTMGDVEYNKAILQFMRALPPTTKIILWWH